MDVAARPLPDPRLGQRLRQPPVQGHHVVTAGRLDQNEAIPADTRHLRLAEPQKNRCTDRGIRRLADARDIPVYVFVDGDPYGYSNIYRTLKVGSGNAACREALDRLEAENVGLNYCRVRAFPFDDTVKDFLAKHETVYVVEQNRDAQLRTLLILDADGDPKKLVPLLHYNGMPINAGFVVDAVLKEISKGRAA